nr:PREDICTED: C-X-C chemokine receptor type 1-like [Lepisosteus oculatus]
MTITHVHPQLRRPELSSAGQGMVAMAAGAMATGAKQRRSCKHTRRRAHSQITSSGRRGPTAIAKHGPRPPDSQLKEMQCGSPPVIPVIPVIPPGSRPLSPSAPSRTAAQEHCQDARTSPGWTMATTEDYYYDWAACLGLSLVDVCYREVVPAPSFGGRLCLRAFHPDSSDRWRLALQALDVALGFAAPLLVMLYCYARIFRSLCLASRRQRQRSLRLIVSVVAAFLLTWAPYNAFLLADSLLRLELLPASCQLEAVLDVGTLAAESLGLAHCAVNPLLYAFVGVKFRRELGRMCKGALGGRGAGGRRWGHRGRGGHKSRRVTGSMTSDSETSSTYYSVVM